MGELFIPKWWRSAIPVPFEPLKGELARPCICGYDTDPEGDRIIYLIRWFDGTLMFAHEDCVGRPGPNASV